MLKAFSKLSVCHDLSVCHGLYVVQQKQVALFFVAWFTLQFHGW